MKQIRKQLSEMGVDVKAECRGCMEKSQFIEERRRRRDGRTRSRPTREKKAVNRCSAGTGARDRRRAVATRSGARGRAAGWAGGVWVPEFVTERGQRGASGLCRRRTVGCVRVREIRQGSCQAGRWMRFRAYLARRRPRAHRFYICARRGLPLFCVLPSLPVCAARAPPGRGARTVVENRVCDPLNEAGKYAQPSAVSLDISQPSGRQ